MSIRDEFEFIKNITPKQGLSKDVVVGIGDDAAVVRAYHGTDLIACTDTMVEEVHFKRDTMSPFHIGYKALAANISDVAAMGGIPSFYLVSIVVPKSWSENELIDIYKGMDALAAKHKMVLIGGDTVSTKGPLVVSITVLGRVEQGKCLKRSDAKPGDIVFLTGTVGDSAAGLHILLSEKTNNESFHYLINRHQMPTPQTAAGEILHSFHRVSANDISDGVASEAREIAEASHVDLVINESLIPLSNEIMMFGREQAIKWALYGGEDYELIGTTSPDQWEKIEQKFKQDKLSITKVGEVRKGSGKAYLKTPIQVIELGKLGYNHFKHGDEDDNK
jgi:thiamine-monophosphate kinase